MKIKALQKRAQCEAIRVMVYAKDSKFDNPCSRPATHSVNGKLICTQHSSKLALENLNERD